MYSIWANIKHYKKAIALTIASFLIFIVVGSLFNLQMAQIPFNPDIWGTVSDWIIVLITTLGTLYIVLSFNEQRKINEQQAEINRLSMERDRREIRPQFKIKAQSPLNAHKYSAELRLEHAFAQEVIVSYSKTSRYVAVGSMTYSSEWEVGDVLRLLASPNLSDDAIAASIGIVDIKFKDEDGRSYIQNITFMEKRFDISFPKQISTYSIWDGATTSSV